MKLDLYFGKNWHSVIETMTEGLMLVDPGGTILYVNRAFEQLLLYDKGELVGKRCDVLECDSCFGKRGGGDGKYCALFSKKEVRNLKCTFRRKDGRFVSVLKNAAILRAEDGKTIAGVENLTDLSALEEKEQVITTLKRQLSPQKGFEGLIGNSMPMVQLFDLTSSAARSNAPVILYGESGTGKELVATALHTLGLRREGPFIKVNCAALNENLLESELFGHAKGAFTGANQARIGRFEAADTGDIFLDEIGDMPLPLQTKLLRVLQEHEIERVGDHRPIPVDTRIITATNKNIQRLIGEGLFREDLYFRIGVIPIHLPPLRERREDIPLLLEAFIERARRNTGKDINGVAPETLERFYRYNWPGNVRELENVIEYAFVLCPEGDILPAHLPPHFAGAPSIINIPACRSQLRQTDDERQRLKEALIATGGNRTKAAGLLGISRVTLWKRLKKYQIHEDTV